MALWFYWVLVNEFSVALAAASKGKRCVQSVKICGFALWTERGRHGELPWDLNYSSLFYYILTSIVLTAVAVTLPFCLLKFPNICPRSGLEQEDMRVLYRYLTTSLIPVTNEEVRSHLKIICFLSKLHCLFSDAHNAKYWGEEKINCLTSYAIVFNL